MLNYVYPRQVSSVDTIPSLIPCHNNGYRRAPCYYTRYHGPHDVYLAAFEDQLIN